MLLLGITRQACSILRRHAVGIGSLDPGLTGIIALLCQAAHQPLHQAAPLLSRHLLVVLLMHLLDHLWGSILHELLVVLPYFLLRKLSICSLIPGTGISL